MTDYPQIAELSPQAGLDALQDIIHETEDMVLLAREIATRAADPSIHPAMADAMLAEVSQLQDVAEQRLEDVESLKQTWELIHNIQ